jgi:hypothetical protein
MTPNERWYLSRSSKRRTPVVALILLAFMVIIVVSAATRSSSPTVTTIPGVAAKAQLNHFSTGSTTIYHNFTADMAKCTTLNCGMNAANRAFYAEGSVASNIDQSIYPARLISQLTMVEGYLVSLQKIYLYMTESKALTDITTQQARLAGPLGALTTTVATMIHDIH